MIKRGLLFFILFSLFLPQITKGINNSGVIINEIAWMGTTNSVNDEWIELYNNTGKSVSLDGWSFKTADEKLIINLKNNIPARGFYLLERTDDTTVPDVAADLIYKGALNNNGEYLGLYNVLNNLVDEIDCSLGWFTGDNTTKQTMEKTPIGWRMSENPGGTPRAENGTGAVTKAKPIIIAETPQNPPEPIKMLEEMPAKDSSPQTYLEGIVFNEILPSPEGPDETEEWIEIYNQNNFEVNLAGWRVKDSEGNINIYVFPTATTIKSNGYLVLTRPLTKIILNNTGDRLILLKPDGKTSDIVSYTKSPTGQSYNRTDNEWHWSNVLTPGLTNIIKNETIKKTQNNGKETKENILNDEQIAAVLNQNTKQLKPFLSVLLTALSTAAISTTVFLFLKKRLKK